ncbi:4600_t:CDS:2 [Entrophospora sp. SA101]|nr:4600_t:CDS:2 [Entrophospora sp. SA101]
MQRQKSLAMSRLIPYCTWLPKNDVSNEIGRMWYGQLSERAYEDNPECSITSSTR